MTPGAPRSMSSENHPGTPGFGRLGELLFAAAAFQCLRASCETGLLDKLASAHNGASKEDIATAIGVNGRWLDILLTGASAIGLIRRDTPGLYVLEEDITVAVRDPDWPRFKAAVAFEQHITYPGIHDFTESLIGQTNVGIRNFSGQQGQSLYERLGNNPDLSDVFYAYMRSWSLLGNPVLLEALRGINAQRLLDVGGGDGVNSIAAVRHTAGLRGTVLDIPATTEIAKRAIFEAGLSDRIEVLGRDIFADPFPSGHDAILFAHQLVIWNEEENLFLLRKANASLPIGGHVVIFSSMADDAEDGPLIAALASVYHACIPVEGGRIYPWAQYENWLAKGGFGNIRRVESSGWTPHGVIIAEKTDELAPGEAGADQRLSV